MTKLTQLVKRNSAYLSRDDLAGPTNISIGSFRTEEVDGDEKTILDSPDLTKPLILNVTNAEMLAYLLGDDVDGAIGKTVCLYVDPHVMYERRRVGGIRIRAAEVSPGNPPGNGAQTPQSGSSFDSSKLSEKDVKILQNQIALKGKAESDLLQKLGLGSVFSIEERHRPAVREWLAAAPDADVPW